MFIFWEDLKTREKELVKKNKKWGSMSWNAKISDTKFKFPNSKQNFKFSILSRKEVCEWELLQRARFDYVGARLGFGKF